MRSLLVGTAALALFALAPRPADADAGQPAALAMLVDPDAGEQENAEPTPQDVVGQDDGLPVPLAFEGGYLTVTQPEEYGDKILSYNGREIARDYFVSLQRVTEVAGVKVAIYDVGPGGNACGPAALLIWKPEGGDIRTAKVGEDCGAPPAAVSDDRIVFLPYVLPGGTAPVLTWSPDAGVTTAGELHFSPEPGTGWEDLDAAELDSMIDAMHNAAVLHASSKLLGDRLEEVVTGLSVSGAPEISASGMVYGSGCTPHACGLADSFMAVDAKRKAVYFAHQGETRIDTWPALKRWPEEIRDIMRSALAKPE